MNIPKHLLVSDVHTYSNSLFIEEEEGGRWKCLCIGFFFRYFNQNVNMSNNAIANTNANGILLNLRVQPNNQSKLH